MLGLPFFSWKRPRGGDQSRKRALAGGQNPVPAGVPTCEQRSPMGGWGHEKTAGSELGCTKTARHGRDGRMFQSRTRAEKKGAFFQGCC